VTAALSASPAGIEVGEVDAGDGGAAPALAPGDPGVGGPSTRRVVDVAGRSWPLAVRDADGRLLEGVLPQSSLVLLCGVLLTAALAAYLVVATRRVERTEDDVRERTADLAKANEILSVEIATRARAESTLAAHEQRFRSLMQGSADVLVELRNGIVEYITPNFDKTLGDSVEALLGHSLAEFVHPDDLSGLAHYFQPGWTGAIDATVRLGPPGGPWGWREARGVRMIDPDGVPHGIIVIRDIDARRQAEDALRASERRARAMLAAIPDLMFRLSSDGVYLDFKAERDEDLYVAPERIIGGNIRDLLPGEVAQPALGLIRLALEQGGVRTLEYALLKDGETHEYEARISRSGEDEVTVICRDVTERKRADSALRESERRFRELADGAPFVIYMTDEDFQTVFVNKAMLSFTGRTFDEQLAVPLGVNRHPEDARRLREISRAAIARRERFTCEGRYRNATGEYRWLITDAQPRTDHEGKYAGYIGYSIDITDRLKAERRAYAAADREAVLRERQRIAQELHDSVAQYFFAIGMACNPASAPSGEEETAARFARVRGLASVGGEAIRRAIHTLADEPDEPISETIRRLCEGQADGPAVTFRCRQDIPHLSATEAALLRGAAQEALFNARKHASASNVHVTLTVDLDSVRLTVCDDGSGGAEDIRRRMVQGTGFGLPSLVTRFNASGGRVMIADCAGGGVDISFAIPLNGARIAA
jgi:PAS domain S-box-containing protein